MPLPGGGVLHCYIPLTAMGTPPPTKARKVLKKGEVRPFVLAGLDPPRRVAELALPTKERSKKQRGGAPVPAPPAPAKWAGTKQGRASGRPVQPPATKGPGPTKKAAAKKGPPASKKAAAKKQAKKAPSKKAKAPASAAPAKKAAKAKKVAKTAAPNASAQKSGRAAGKRSTGAKRAPAKKTSRARA